MDLRFWKWDRVFNFAAFAALFGVAGSIYLLIGPVAVVSDADGNEVLQTIWQQTSVVAALLFALLPILITGSPLVVLSRTGGIHARQLGNLWLSLAMLAGYMALTFQSFGLVYTPALVFSVSASVAATVQRMRGNPPPGPGKRRDPAIRMSGKGPRRGGGRNRR